jgi:hypothetical protein
MFLSKELFEQQETLHLPNPKSDKPEPLFQMKLLCLSQIEENEGKENCMESNDVEKKYQLKKKFKIQSSLTKLINAKLVIDADNNLRRKK